MGHHVLSQSLFYTGVPWVSRTGERYPLPQVLAPVVEQVVTVVTPAVSRVLAASFSPGVPSNAACRTPSPTSPVSSWKASPVSSWQPPAPEVPESRAARGALARAAAACETAILQEACRAAEREAEVRCLKERASAVEAEVQRAAIAAADHGERAWQAADRAAWEARQAQEREAVARREAAGEARQAQQREAVARRAAAGEALAHAGEVRRLQSQLACLSASAGGELEGRLEELRRLAEHYRVRHGEAERLAEQLSAEVAKLRAAVQAGRQEELRRLEAERLAEQLSAEVMRLRAACEAEVRTVRGECQFLQAKVSELAVQRSVAERLLQQSQARLREREREVQLQSGPKEAVRAQQEARQPCSAAGRPLRTAHRSALAERLAAIDGEASLRAALTAWREVLRARKQVALAGALRAANASAAEATRSARAAALDRACLSFYDPGALRWSLLLWRGSVQAQIARRQQLAASRFAVFDSVARFSCMAASRMLRRSLFTAWARWVEGLRTLLQAEEVWQQQHAALLETQRQAAAARQAAGEESLGRELADIQAEVAGLHLAVGEKDLRIHEMEDELGEVTSQLLEERWALTGARARLEGFGLDAGLSGSAKHTAGFKGLSQAWGLPLPFQVETRQGKCTCTFGLGCAEA